MAQALAFSESMRQLSLATLRVRYPERSQLQLVELLLGVSLETANAGRAPVR